MSAMTAWARDADVAAARQVADMAFAAWRGAADSLHAVAAAVQARDIPAAHAEWALDAAHAHAELLRGTAERADRRARALEETWRELCATLVKAGTR